MKDLAGDGLLALFGAPVSHEDDVERAILAGLDIARATSGYAATVARDWGYEGLDVRVGIDVGLAVLGPVGGGRRVEYGAVGDVLNTAARLQSAASPGAVLVSEAARGEATSRFEWGPPTELTLKGKDEPVVASVAVRPHRAYGRLSPRWDAPFVGRAEALSLLEEAVADLSRGLGSAVLITGEPGLGKSRLVAEARRRAVSGRYGTPIRWLEGRCLSWADGVPFGLFRHLLAGWLGISADDPAERVASALEAAVRHEAIDREHAEVLGLVFAGGEREAGSAHDADDAETIRERVFDAVEATFVRLAASRPLAISLEDLHWADPTSLALTDRLLSAVGRAPLVLLVTRRPESGHPSGSTLDAAAERLGASARSIVLAPLREDEHRELLRVLVGGANVPERIRSPILATTEGNPFFLEEQVRSLEETGALVRDADGPRFRERVSAGIPRTVERVLLARIDRLQPTDKDVLLAASVLGREFEPTLLERVIADGESVRASLDTLSGLDLIRAEGLRYRFKHALIQESAYRSLLKRRRRELHGRAAAAIESSYEGRAEEVAGALGRHLQEAGEPARAVPFLTLAADRAGAAFANEEAISWYERAVEAVGAIPGGERDAVESDLHAKRAAVLGLRGRYDEARAAYRRSLELVPPADRIRTAGLLTDAAFLDVSDHRYADALDQLDRAEAALGRQDDPGGADPESFRAWLEIQFGRMNAYYWLNDLAAYERLIDRVRPTVEARGTPQQRSDFFGLLHEYLLRRDRYVVTDETLDVAHRSLDASLALDDPRQAAWARFSLGFALLWADRFEEAREMLLEGMREGDRFGDVTLRSRTRTYLLVVDRRRNDPTAAERAIDDVIEAAREASLPEYEAIAVANRSWVHARAGRSEDAEADARAALDRWRRLPVRYPFEWMALWPLLEIELERDRPAEAIQCSRDMLADHQQPLAPELRAHVERAVDAWAAGDRDRAASELASARPLARRLAYL